MPLPFMKEKETEQFAQISISVNDPIKFFMAFYQIHSFSVRYFFLFSVARFLLPRTLIRSCFRLFERSLDCLFLSYFPSSYYFL